MSENVLNIKKKKTKPRLKDVKLEDVKRKLLNILARESSYLWSLSINHKLEEEDSKALVNYLKLLKQLDEPIDPDSYTIEELEKIANKK